MILRVFFSKIIRLFVSRISKKFVPQRVAQLQTHN